MKKILARFTGTVVVVAILVACGSIPEINNDIQRVSWEELDTVIIYLKAIEIDGEKHLEMYDSNDPTITVVDNLETFVRDSTVVYWVLAPSSGLRKINWVKPKESGGNILPGGATGLWLLNKYKKHVVPDGQEFDDIQAYKIKVKDENNESWEIDPHLKIPPGPSPE